GGGKKLEEPLIVRPTSETIINEMFSKWIRSYRDLPLLINQWANIVRWEKRTRLFIRTTEFLWQEGHTCHATREEANEKAMQMLEIYRQFAEDWLAIPAVTGRKSETEKFAGADATFAIEGLMGDGKALQMGTSHSLGQNFSKAFGTQFLDADGQLQNVWQTSWGMTTRLIGAVIMVHGDEKGLRLPPTIAPIQTVIVPIWKTDREKAQVIQLADSVFAELKSAGIRVKMDDRDQFTPGFKYNEWEMKGVPLRLEIGPRDVADNAVMAARRDIKGKEKVSVQGIAETVKTVLDSIQKTLFEQALAFREANTRDASTMEEMAQLILKERGFVRVWWEGDADAEAKVKEDTKATLRCFPLDQQDEEGICVATGKKTKSRALFAVAY
ncbi:MAG TPA: proline--tRNA ligase, partial [Armatimonadota bacterium]|nr:proline--tRNA ligase [Armatimonadota bacterium]